MNRELLKQNLPLIGLVVPATQCGLFRSTLDGYVQYLSLSYIYKYSFNELLSDTCSISLGYDVLSMIRIVKTTKLYC